MRFSPLPDAAFRTIPTKFLKLLWADMRYVVFKTITSPNIFKL